MDERLSQTSGLAPEVLDLLRQAFARHPGVERVWLYGSRARGDYRPDSDIDLAVDAPTADAAAFAALWADVDALPVVFSVDLLNLRELQNEALRSAIARDRVQIYPAPPPHSPTH